MSFRGRNSLGGSPSLELLSESDPQEEARERRHRQKKRQSVVGLSTPSVEVSSPKKTGAFLAEHYTNCIKLSAENKINVKNAFSLQLIDYLAEKFISSKEKRSSDGNTFQAASCALDASTKIYAYRVDSVHTDALKLAGGVGASEANLNSRNEDEHQDFNPNESLADHTKKTKTLKRSKNTIEKNLRNITLSKMELNFDVDPLFKRTTSKYDSGGRGNYFIKTLDELDDEAQLIWDPDATTKSGHLPSLASSLAESLPQRALSLDMLNGVPQATICPAFEGFNFREWTLEDDDLNSSIIGFSQPMTSTQKDGDGEHAFNIHAPVPEDFDDFTAADADMDIHASEDNVMESVAQAGYKGERGLFITDNLRDILTSVPLEYSYFDDTRIGSFAGPKHWKFRQPTIRVDEGKKDSAKKKAPKEDNPLDFTKLDKEESTFERVKRLMGKPKKTTRLQPKTIQTWSVDKRMSPEELRYKGSDFINLSLINIVPSCLSQKSPPTLNDGGNEDLGDIGDYDYDNVNDAENFCPADMGNSNYDEQRTIDPTQEMDGLVSAPNKVEKINILYAKLAKKMDMKRLKYVEWDILKTDSEEKENQIESDPINQSMSGSKTFSLLYKNLETSSKMPQKMIENLSVPLAFAALLHLCNEHSLKLQGSEDLTDFVVMQG